MGVDGAEYTPGDLWGHANIDATTLAAGQHEFDVLGFEPCCDGHAELEVHLPWRQLLCNIIYTRHAKFSTSIQCYL